MEAINFTDLPVLVEQLKSTYKLKEFIFADGPVHPLALMKSRAVGVFNLETINDLIISAGFSIDQAITEVIMILLQEDKQETDSWEGKTFIGYQLIIGDMVISEDFMPTRQILIRFNVV